MIEFVEFPKIARLNREIVVTEKIDGTNAQIFITDEPDPENRQVIAGSRTRWLTPAVGYPAPEDNFGFRAWVDEHREELLKLGPGRHFGEWWGMGIQRKYGLSERRFSLFNTIRWCAHDKEPQPIPTPDPRIVKMQERLPACCHLVPVLYRGPFGEREIVRSLESLRENGSAAAPGFMKPEGIVVYHVAGNVGFKVTLEKDDEPKSLKRTKR